VTCGEEALAVLDLDCRFNLVILDMNMPGLGGAATLPHLRALRPGLPVLLTTGRSDTAALELLDTYPGVGMLAKPFMLEDLRQSLETLRRARLELSSLDRVGSAP
jgi:CheY-like chemotaxis protein